MPFVEECRSEEVSVDLGRCGRNLTVYAREVYSHHEAKSALFNVWKVENYDETPTFFTR